MGLGEVGLGDVGVRRAELVLCLLLPRSPKLRVKMRLRLSTASNRDLRRSWEGVPSEQFRKSRGCDCSAGRFKRWWVGQNECELSERIVSLLVFEALLYVA